MAVSRLPRGVSAVPLALTDAHIPVHFFDDSPVAVCFEREPSAFAKCLRGTERKGNETVKPRRDSGSKLVSSLRFHVFLSEWSMCCRLYGRKLA